MIHFRTEIRKEYESLQKEIRRDKSLKKKAEQQPHKKSNPMIEKFKAESQMLKSSKSNLPRGEQVNTFNIVSVFILNYLKFNTFYHSHPSCFLFQSEILFERFRKGIQILKEKVSESDLDTDAKKEIVFEDPNAAAVFSHKFSYQNDEAAILAKDANLKNEEEWYDIHDPRNPINKRRREAEEAEKPRKKIER